MQGIVGMVLVGVGVFLWFWGGWRLSGTKSFLWKIHALSVSDTIGSLFILTGLLVRSFDFWPHLLLAMASVAFWGTALSFVLARLINEPTLPGQKESGEEDAG